MRASVVAMVVCLLGFQSGGRADGPKTATAGQLLITEFRLHGPGGPQDEYIEIYNSSASDHTVAAASGTGYGIAASDGVTRCSIPNGTVIPNRGHYLCVNSAGYSVGSYPAGSGATATGDASYTTDIPDNAGIAIFNNNTGGGSYTPANRLDAVGSTSEANATYVEGTGYPALVNTSLDHAYVRRQVPTCTGSSGGGGCTSVQAVKTNLAPNSSQPFDSNNNSFDFYFVDTAGTGGGAEQRLGAPGPENLSSPILTSNVTQNFLQDRFDTCAGPLAEPNRHRDLTPDVPNNSTLGTLEFRRTWTNKTGGNITRLRFRIIDVTTVPSIAGVADFRARSSPDIPFTVDRPPCGTLFPSLTLRGTTVEQPPSQTSGGGYNTSLSVASVSTGTPLANNADVSVRFLLGVQQAGVGRFCAIPETVPATNSRPFCFVGNSDSNIAWAPGDFDFDQIADITMYNPATAQWKVYLTANALVSSFTLGGPGYMPVPADYDGDGRSDSGAYKESSGTWQVPLSSANSTQTLTFSWGGIGYQAVPGDYDGDGLAEIAVYNPATGYWHMLTSTTAYQNSLTISWGGPGYTPVAGQDFDGDKRSDLVVYNERLGIWYVLKSTTNFATGFTMAWGGVGYTLVPGDYDGDGKSDFGLYQRGTGFWYILKSSTNYTASMSISFGGMGFVPMPGDYDGDGKFDIAVHQLALTKFFALTSSSSYDVGSPIVKTVGTTSDQPVSSAVLPRTSRQMHAGDFDGDFRSDISVYNATTGLWASLKSNSNFVASPGISWGGVGYGPAPGDYDGDGKADLGLYSGSGQWLVLLSSTNFTTVLNKSAGGAGYVPKPGDYDGDGKTDLVVYNSITGLWFGLKSSTNYTTAITATMAGNQGVTGDFDGDGKLDLGTYDDPTGLWTIRTSSSGYASSITRTFGGAGYTPVPADFDGDGITDFAVYRNFNGEWTVLKSSSGNSVSLVVPYGGPGYTPVAGDWDGDGRADIGVYNTATGAWSILLSGAGYTVSLSKNLGGAGYQAIQVFP